MQGSLPRLIFMSAIGGISNAAVLAAINAGAQAGEDDKKAPLWAAVLFIVALFLFFKSQNFIIITTTVEIQAIIHKLRLRLMDQVRRSELLPLDTIGRARIIGAITGDTAILTQASNMLAFSVQGLVLIIFVALYVAYLSLAAFALSVVIIGAVATISHFRTRWLSAGTREAAEGQGRLFERLSDFLDGFKEVRLNRLRSEALFDDAAEVSRTAANMKIVADTETFKQIVASQAAMHALLGAVVFIAPQFSDSMGGADISKTTTALLFVVGACFGVAQSIPVLLAANEASDRLEQLEAALKATVVSKEISVTDQRKHFDKIEVRGVQFRYVDQTSDIAFGVGPLDFTLRSGELVFITGGNGSGKSTFLRILSALYMPDSGEILLDGMPVNDDTRDIYRSLIAGIFTDYHLFQRLYGIESSDPGEIAQLLTKFRLNEKTRITDGEFRTLDLSGGQRKRIALLVSLLEKRPILLLDEWTSDQDPEFRRKFYHEFLPELMKAGATVVVITHDDRYLDELHLTARRLRMDEGRFIEERAVEDGR
jgi:putative ATP-binding cassette transporter